MTVDIAALRALVRSIAGRYRPTDTPTRNGAVEDVKTLVALAYDTLDEIERLQAALKREREAANRNARLAADMADERDTATARERERIADWFTQEADVWRINNNTDEQCEYDRAAQMVRDSAGRTFDA